MLKIAEFLSLIVFFLCYKFYDLIFATKVLIITSISISITHYIMYKKLPIANMITVVLLTLFGGLTVYTDNTMFIKIKPTIVYVLFAAIIIITMLLKDKNLVYVMMKNHFELSKQKWQKLAYYWAIFFCFNALMNELVWRLFTEDVWVKFKIIGMPTILIVFMLLQFYSLRNHLIKR